MSFVEFHRRRVSCAVFACRSHTDMCLQKYLVEKFKNWKPPAPEVINRTKSTITMCWGQVDPFGFLAEDLLYIIEKNNKIPKWIVVYSGGKITKPIDNLAPRHPHRFRLKVILKANAVPYLADKALAFYKDENAIYEVFHKIDNNTKFNDIVTVGGEMNHDAVSKYVPTGVEATFKKKEKTIEENEIININKNIDLYKDTAVEKASLGREVAHNCGEKQKWIESLWSEETWTNTDTDGTSAVCFSMAVRCGYLKQVQGMLEERPDLIDIINTSNVYTPLATAIRKGNINLVRFLVSFGADVNQTSSTGQTPLQLAVLSGNITITEFLLDNGANCLDRDWNGLRVEHYAVDSCSLDMVKLVLDRGGDVNAQDNNGWTPLFRAVCQDANTEIIEELTKRGSDVDVKDRAGLSLTSVAKLLKNRYGRSRDSILQLVDSNYPHDKALANFTRLTKKAHNVHSLLQLI